MFESIRHATVLLAPLALCLYVAVVWWIDRFEREPLRWVLIAWAWGAIGAIWLSLTTFHHIVLPLDLDESTLLIAIGPLIEECAKALVFIPLVVTGHFDDEVDGLVYGAAIGIGFAMTENFFYFDAALLSASFFELVALRSFFSALVHLLATAIVGVALAWTAHRAAHPRGWIVGGAAGLLLGWATHSVWNLLAGNFFGSAQPLFTLSALIWVVLLLVAMIGLARWCLSQEHAFILRVLLDEADRGVLPHAHAEIIPFWTERNRPGWAPEGVDRAEYIRCATRLAFRIHQLELAGGARRQRTHNEIQRCREQLRRWNGSPM